MLLDPLQPDRPRRRRHAASAVRRFGDGIAGGRTYDLDWLADLNSQLHRRVLDLSGNALFPHLVRSAVQLPLVVSTFGRCSADQLKRSMRLHHELADALTAHDQQRASAIVRPHVLVARRVPLDAREASPA